MFLRKSIVMHICSKYPEHFSYGKANFIHFKLIIGPKRYLSPLLVKIGISIISLRNSNFTIENSMLLRLVSSENVLLMKSVYVRVCVFCFHRKSLSWLDKTINIMSEFKVTDGMLRKYFYIKYLCRNVIYNHSRNLQADKCAKEWQLNQAKLQEIKDNSYKLSKNQRLKCKT